MNKADPTTWLYVMTAFTPALFAVCGVLATIYFTNRRERDRQEHERMLKDAELEAARVARLRDERIAAYRRLLAATAAQEPPTELKQVDEVTQAYTEVELLHEDIDLLFAALEIWEKYGDAFSKNQEGDEVGSVQAMSDMDKGRTQFKNRARKELGFDEISGS